MKNRRFKIKCGSKYFQTKYGKDPVIVLEGEEALFHNPPTFLFQGRVLAEGRPDLLKGIIYYGHVDGMGEYIHESEIGEEVP